MLILHSIPAAALIAVCAATIFRGFQVARTSGDRPWAFATAKGIQRLAGSSFALSIAVLFVAAVPAPARAAPGWAMLAAVLATGGAAIVIVAQVQMGRAWRIGVREGDAPLFISAGLFRYSRNPIFAGMALVGLAVAIVATSWWGWAALALFIASCAVQVHIEEAHLEKSFGQPYRDFRARVPRWIGWRRS